MDKGMIMWIVFLIVFLGGVLISRKIRKSTEEEGIETEAVVSRIVDDGTQEYTDINVYVKYIVDDGTEIEGILSNPRTDLEEGQQVHIKYNPKYKSNARLLAR